MSIIPLKPDYQFVFTNPTLGDFMGQDTGDRAFLIRFNSVSTPTEVTVANTTFKRFLELYEERIEEYNRGHPDGTISPTYLASGLYDAIWA